MNDTAVLSDARPPNVYGPLTPSQMFERTAALLRENPRLFFGIALILIGVEFVVVGALGGSGIWINRSTIGAAPIIKMLFIVPLSLLGAALIYIFTQIVQGALFIATQARMSGASMSVGEACRLAADRAGRLIGISLLIALRILGYMLLFYFVAAAVFLVAALAFGGFPHTAGRFSIHPGHFPSIGLIVFFGFFLLAVLVLYIAALLWLFTRYALSIPASLAENISITESIRRSIYLTRGSKGRLYALFLFIFCIYLGIAAVTFPIQMMSARAAMMHPVIPPAAFDIITVLLAIFRILVSAIVVAFAGVATALCYYDLRMRKEGFGATVATPVPEIPSAVQPPAPDLPMEDFPVS